MSIKDVIKKLPKTAAGPLWKGPEAEGPLGGVTQSMISAWLGCRERFRVKYLEGWRAEEQFNKYLEYGQMWHVCEEAFAKAPGDKHSKEKPHEVWMWESKLRDYCTDLCRKYPTQQDEVDHWYRTCKAQFPVYVDYWAKHRDVEQRTPLMQEQVFNVPYELPSGRIIRLRGKFDSVDLIGKGKSAGIYLQENKTKGDVDRKDLEEQLTWDLQTMLYLVAMQQEQELAWKNAPLDIPKEAWSAPILGVRYNVVRRPFSGGKGSIKRREPSKSNPRGESKDEFYARLQNDYFRAEPEYWFQRWKSEVSPEDVKRFRKECLDPILEAMCNWYDVQLMGHPYANFAQFGHHWRHPFGVKNSTDEGYKSDVDQYINTGSTVGLTRVSTLFTELQ